MNELDNGADVFDGTYLELSINGGTSYTTYDCRTEDVMSTTVIGSGKVATCDELVTVVEGLNVRGYAYVWPDGLLTAVTYEITNTTASTIAFKWRQNHNYGEGDINGNGWNDTYTIGDGSSNGTHPAAVAWGPTTQACSAAGGTNDSYDDMEVESESCSLAGGATTAVTFFHMADLPGNLANLQSNTQAFFDVRSFDSTLIQGIPSGLTAANWGLTGTMVTTNIPPAADPFDPTETMTLTGDAVLGNNMTIAFKNGVDPVGTYFDVWMCPNKDVKPVDGVEVGECEVVTFWERALVANYSQDTTALTMTWKLANEAVPGLVAAGGASYLNGSGEPIMMGEPEADGGWCAYEGWFMIVNDYDGGAHSNWSPAIGAAGCSGLANTGVDAQQTGVLGLLTLLAGLGVVVARRRGAFLN